MVDFLDTDWRKKHEEIERLFLEELGSSKPLVLKGGTALMMCYGLNRFSEDLCFDSLAPRFSTVNFSKKFCEKHGFECITKKETNTVQRVMIHYGGNKPLKIETSYRREDISPGETDVVGGIKVYKINTLATMKVTAYLARNKLRDLYDVTFLANQYWDSLSDSNKVLFESALSAKGLEYFDYIIETQKDDLIDPNALANNFLHAYEKVGLLIDKDEQKELIQETTQAQVSSSAKPKRPSPAELAASAKAEAKRFNEGLGNNTSKPSHGASSY